MENLWSGNNIETNNHEKRKAEWETARKKVDTIVDKLGLGIDEGIKDFVATLNAMGIPTTSSCAGHTNEDDEGFAIPYIEIYTPRPRDWREDPDAQKHWTLSNQKESEKLLPLLNQFYENRAVKEDVRIDIHPMGLFGGFRLQSTIKKRGPIPQDENYYTKATENVREYQKEMEDFGNFLKEKFLNTE